VETTLIARTRNIAALAASALMVALLTALALSGRSPGLPELSFEPHGIVAALPSDITAAEIRTGQERIGFRRTKGGAWSFERSNAPAPAELTSHLDLALHFMHVSQPTRSLDPSDYEAANFAEFGLDPPAYLVSLEQPDRSVIVADFGTLNPAGTSQYLRLVGLPTVHLMPRHVGTEWEVTADIARRILPPEAGGGDENMKGLTALLLPASIDRIWAIEIVIQGKLHRLERDGAGNWLLHTGQHAHAGNSDAHIADPDKARIIATALAALDQTQIETVVAKHPSEAELERYGLSRPEVIALMYARDSSSPLVRLAIGNVSGDGFSRYARLSGGDVVTIAAYTATNMVQLLRAVGAAS
jgi:Domain of unknown function (DUF4340)